MNLHRFYFEFTDSNDEDVSYYVYAYNLQEAKDHFTFHVIDEYKIPVDFTVEDEGEIDFPTEDQFFEKYKVLEIDGIEGGLLDKHDHWDIIKAISEKEPNNIWSVYDCGEIICGVHIIDVLGYYVTEQPGTEGEIYGYFDGLVA